MRGARSRACTPIFSLVTLSQPSTLSALEAALIHHRIPKQLVRLVKLLYSNQRAILRAEPDEPSVTYHPVTRVRQGCSLAPLLFTIVIDMLAWHLEAVSTTDGNVGIPLPLVDGYSIPNLLILLYADDFVLFGNDEASLQKLVNATADWSTHWGFQLSHTKSKVMCVPPRDGGCRPPPNVTVGGSPVEVVNVFKYLGFNISDDLSMIKETNTRLQLFSAAHSSLDALYKSNTWPITCRLLAYTSLAESVGFYGTTAWLTTFSSFKKFMSLTASHLRILLSLQKVPTLTIACLELRLQHPWALEKFVQGKWLFQ